VREGIDPYTTDLGFEGGLEPGLGGDEAGRVWEKKYVFVKAMVPGFVNEDFAKKVS
jgi:gamma-tubulin complex component 3